MILGREEVESIEVLLALARDVMECELRYTAKLLFWTPAGKGRG